MEEYVKKLAPLVKQVAANTQIYIPASLDADDLEQDLWETIITQPSLQTTLMTVGEDTQRKILTRKAKSACKEARIEYLAFSGQFKYSVEEVKNIMKKDALGETLSYTEAADLDLGLKRLAELQPKIYDHYEEFKTNYPKPAKSTEKYRRSRLFYHVTTALNLSHHELVTWWNEEHNKKESEKF